MNIYEKLLAIQLEFKAPKDKYNAFGKYNYRSAEGILEAIKPLLEKYKATVRIVEELQEINGLPVIKSMAHLDNTEKNEGISAVAFAGVEKAGGMALPQAYGSASSYAKKYALGNLLLIDDTQDADAINEHGKGKGKGSKPKLVKGTDTWSKAVAYIKNGGSINNITSKYAMTQEAQDVLVGEAMS